MLVLTSILQRWTITLVFFFKNNFLCLTWFEFWPFKIFDLNPFKMLRKGSKDNEKTETFVLKIFELFTMKQLIQAKAVSLGLHNPHCTAKQKLMDIWEENQIGLCLMPVLCLAQPFLTLGFSVLWFRIIVQPKWLKNYKNLRWSSREVVFILFHPPVITKNILDFPQWLFSYLLLCTTWR